MRVEFYFDFSCPYAYIGATRIERITRAAGAELVWRPMLLGGVFRDIGLKESPMSQMSPAKMRHNALDMHRWAEHFNVPLTMPAGHPMRTVGALRALLSMPESAWPAAIHGFYRAYWQRGEQPSAPQTIEAVAREAGLDDGYIAMALTAHENEDIKAELRRRTDDAVSRGVFGAPTMFVQPSGEDRTDSLMFWGQDRLEMTEAALAGWRPGTGQAAAPSPTAKLSASPKQIDFWYDFSSPFSYLGSTQIESIAERTGATLTWRPMLLGAVFKHLGTPNVPMLAVSEPKRNYYARELDYWASYWGVPFKFTSRFPMKTVTALRLALQAGDRIAELSHALYRALWVDNDDLNDEATLTRILESGGFDAAAMLTGIRDPAVKQELIANTTEAIESGVFGAPTSIVTDDAGPMVFWGQDRLGLLERVLAGWRPTCG